MDVCDAVAIAVTSDVDVVAARQRGRRLAREQGFTTDEATLLATVISELARNIVTYTNGGTITLSLVRDQERVGIRVVAEDRGPGIQNVTLALRDGYSTSGGLGLGLPGVRRLVDDFSVVSRPGAGTSVSTVTWRR